MTVEHPVERGGEERGIFEESAEKASNFASSPLFFALCILMVAAWAAAYAFQVDDTLRHFLAGLMSAVTLFLVALIKNAERRSEAAIQYKLDAIAQAMLDARRDDEESSMEDLASAVGKHDEV